MNRSLVTFASEVALVAALLSSLAEAQLAEPGSLLVYPEFDSRPGFTTVLTITNTEAGPGSNVRVHFVFLNATDCAEFDRAQLMTSNDTFSTVASSYVPSFRRGWFYAYAQNATTGRPISHNHLIGMTSLIDGVAATSYSLAAIPFRSPLAPNTSTDLDFDGIRDLDGLEYEACNEEILVPRFLGQTASYREELILLPLTGGRAFTTRVKFLVFNDNESLFSASYNVRCWARVPLSSISSVFSNTFLLSSPDAPGESLGGRETGWFIVDGGTASSDAVTIQDPAILAVLVAPESTGGATLPFGRGTQTNGDLFPTGSFGD